MRFAELVECSERVAATRSRREKIAALAACLVNLEPDEAEVGVAALAGRIRQGRIGVGPATVFGVEVPVAPQATLTLTEVDAAMTAIGDARGARAKKRVLGALLERATATEQTFLRRLLVGELRQVTWPARCGGRLPTGQIMWSCVARWSKGKISPAKSRSKDRTSFLSIGASPK